MSPAATRSPRVPPSWFSTWPGASTAPRQTQRRSVPADDREQARLGRAAPDNDGAQVGQERSIILGHLEDGQDLVTLAMNGWQDGHPAWWLALRAEPDAVVQPSSERPRPVRVRPQTGAERERLWKRWAAVDPQLDGYARVERPRHPWSCSSLGRRVPRVGSGAPPLDSILADG